MIDMHGYNRTDEVERALIAAITRALRNSPTQRFGQLIINRVGTNRELWNIYDEEWITIFNGLPA